MVLNLDNSAELKDDNLIAGFKRMGKKMVFYGDDTWLRLFPHMFERVDGTTSFFVTDHTEVCLLLCFHYTEVSIIPPALSKALLSFHPYM